MRDRHERKGNGPGNRIGLDCNPRTIATHHCRIRPVSHVPRTLRRQLPGNCVVSPLRRYRSGFSLAELVVALAIAGVVSIVIIGTLTRQQRFYRGAEQLRDVRESVRDAMEVLSTDIRGMSVGDTIRLRADSALEFFASIGSSVVCQSAGNEVGFPSQHSTGNSLTALQAMPDSGDLAVFYTHLINGAPDWEQHRISGFASRSLPSSCPQSSGLSTQSEIDAGRTGFLVTLADPLRGEIKAGAPVRFLRRARYSLYRAGDGDWYLGYRRCNALGPSSCGAIQPVSGSYRAYSGEPRASGLLFEYFDATGRRLSASDSPLALARVDITARSEVAAQTTSSIGRKTVADSATLSVAIRNGVR
jgi:prepilin-type N-terminal cleavage/methylation domain-containing protein